jgi:hypothetical protein
MRVLSADVKASRASLVVFLAAVTPVAGNTVIYRDRLKQLVVAGSR